MKKISIADKKVSDSEESEKCSLQQSLRELIDEYRIELRNAYFSSSGEPVAYQGIRPEGKVSNIPYDLIYMETWKTTMKNDYPYVYDAIRAVGLNIVMFSIMPDCREKNKLWMLFWVSDHDIIGH